MTVFTNSRCMNPITSSSFPFGYLIGGYLKLNLSRMKCLLLHPQSYSSPLFPVVSHKVSLLLRSKYFWSLFCLFSFSPTLYPNYRQIQISFLLSNYIECYVLRVKYGTYTTRDSWIFVEWMKGQSPHTICRYLIRFGRFKMKCSMITWHCIT